MGPACGIGFGALRGGVIVSSAGATVGAANQWRGKR